MIKKKQPLLNRDEIEAIIKKCEVCYVSMVSPEGEPYVIPMNFGYADNTIYMHSALSGKKIDILRNNPNVCIVFSTDHELRAQNETVACSYSMKFRSALVFGKVELIELRDDKINALNVIMGQYTSVENFKYSEPAIKNVLAMKVKILKMEGREK
ncbi:MAG: pyridoxamine 5'-phosphate oxidase family protein [Hyphomicrobiales bacterium]